MQVALEALSRRPLPASSSSPSQQRSTKNNPLANLAGMVNVVSSPASAGATPSVPRRTLVDKVEAAEAEAEDREDDDEDDEDVDSDQLITDEEDDTESGFLSQI